MSRRYEDFDEFCDPENPRTISLDDVVNAAHRIKPYIPVTPCTPSHYQNEFAMNLNYKLESVHKTGSFKERGAVNFLELLPLDKRKIGLVMASLGNQAVGICFYAAKLGIPVVVVMPTCVPINKLHRCSNLGAKVVVQGNNLLEAQRYARAIARDKGLTYVNGRDHPQILAGYGTVALEILNQVPGVDAIILPVGSGGLAAGVATVIKQLRPSCLIYGVASEKMPVFFNSLEKGDPVSIPIQASLADAISVPNVGVNSFHIVQPLLDKMLLVTEDWIARSILHLIEKERFIVEGAGACTLAAVLGDLVPELKLKNVVCVLTGGNIDSILLARCMDRGLAAEGRLVKFKVGIKDSSAANAQLLKLLANAGYNVIRQFQDHVWVENEIYTVELLVTEDWIARSILHLIEKERFIVEGAGACTLAAVLGDLVPELKLKNVVCVLTGGNIDSILLARCMDRGLAAEGRLVKFKVGIKDSSEANAQLLKLLANAGYNVIRQFQDHVWVENEIYTVEMKLVCETRGLEHALELKRIIERAYPCTSAFETEPFNDKRTCPCYVRKCV